MIWRCVFYDKEKLLPILHDLTIGELKEFDGYISMIRVLSTKKYTLEEIVQEIIDRINDENP